MAANFEKQVASSNFLASLFYAQKCLEVGFALNSFIIFMFFKQIQRVVPETIEMYSAILDFF